MKTFNRSYLLYTVAVFTAVLCAFLLGDAHAGLLTAFAVGLVKPQRDLEIMNLLNGSALNANGVTTFGGVNFPMGEGWYEARLRVNYVIVIGTGAGPVTEGELLAIKAVTLRSDKGENFYLNMPGRAIYKIATLRAGSPPTKDAIAAASATYRVELPLYFADIRGIGGDKMRRPEDTVIDTARYSSMYLDVTMGGLTDLFTAPGTATVAITCDFEVTRTKGPLHPKAKPTAHITYFNRPNVDASAVTTIELERAADLAMKRLYVHSGTSGTAGVPWSGTNADSVQNLVTIKDERMDIVRNRIHEMIRNENKDQATLETALVGVELFDFVKDGSLPSAIYTGDRAALQYVWTNKAGVVTFASVTACVEGVRSLK